MHRSHPPTRGPGEPSEWRPSYHLDRATERQTERQAARGATGGQRQSGGGGDDDNNLPMLTAISGLSRRRRRCCLAPPDDTGNLFATFDGPRVAAERARSVGDVAPVAALTRRAEPCPAVPTPNVSRLLMARRRRHRRRRDVSRAPLTIAARLAREQAATKWSAGTDAMDCEGLRCARFRVVGEPASRRAGESRGRQRLNWQQRRRRC